MRAQVVRCCGVIALALGAAAGIPAASRGDDPAQRADELRHVQAGLAGKERSADLELYAIESRLATAATSLARLERRTAATEHELDVVGARKAEANATLREGHRLLGLRLRTLYEAGDTDPVALMLGAESLQEALDGLDGLHFAAQQDRSIIEQTVAARHELGRIARALQARRTELARLRAQAAARVEELGRAAAARRGYLAKLAAERGLNERRIAQLDAEARSAQVRTSQVSAPAQSTPTQPRRRLPEPSPYAPSATRSPARPRPACPSAGAPSRWTRA